jgi:hypothetical protein
MHTYVVTHLGRSSRSESGDEEARRRGARRRKKKETLEEEKMLCRGTQGGEGGLEAFKEEQEQKQEEDEDRQRERREEYCTSRFFGPPSLLAPLFSI